MTAPSAGRTALSIVIPTFNRRERLHRVLTALAAQSTVTPFEVVVVSDGSSDGTDEYLRSGQTPLPVVAVIQPNEGPGAARNAGVMASTGSIVLFIDDDVVPDVDLVDTHLRAHRATADDVVVIGPMLTPSDATLSPWVAWEQHQLYKQYDAIQRGEWECTFRQFYTGNASAPRQRLVEAGLFDVSFRRAEDVELAYRMYIDGISFRFVPDARGFHYAERSFESWLATAYAYGSNDVAFIESGQEWLTGMLPEWFERRHPLVRWLTRIAVPRPHVADATTHALKFLATVPMLGSRIRRQVLSGLYNLTYYRGVADALGSPERFRRFISGAQPALHEPLRAAFVLEQTLGHVTHSDNLTNLIRADDRFEPTFLPIKFEVRGLAARIPGYGNWTVRAGVRARRAIRQMARRSGIDVMFIHTQVPAMLAGHWMRSIPTVVSLDATPMQYDGLADHYGHALGSARVEEWKRRVHLRSLRRARHLVAWSNWTRDDLVQNYGIPAERISVISPGVDVAKWGFARSRKGAGVTPVRILFVGGDFERKGGLLLVEAVRRLRSESNIPDLELHLVTRADVPPDDWMTVYSGMAPNSPELIALYRRCDVFCLPTLGDCLALVLLEAAASSLALVSTDVGAIHEVVREGDTGKLIPPGDLDALVDALRTVVTDSSLRMRLGAAAHQMALDHHDAAVNARRLVDLLTTVGGSQG